jgi:hypothetical protein
VLPAGRLQHDWRPRFPENREFNRECPDLGRWLRRDVTCFDVTLNGGAELPGRLAIADVAGFGIAGGLCLGGRHGATSLIGLGETNSGELLKLAMPQMTNL